MKKWATRPDGGGMPIAADRASAKRLYRFVKFCGPKQAPNATIWSGPARSNGLDG
ncbi:MAG TPA: hypothetical protein VGP76_14550 [Planctomycetaceae bacterium]|nr:hypothetical protein [Planctomycetaceae bacterium]